ncbi:MAG: hypothetical protein JNK09_12580 [Prolixibacteraceae bacterium]|nr:hypothetical protein [Prolixibacteraceae bacterium]
MRLSLLLFAFWIVAFNCTAQSPKKSLLSAVLMSPDSVAIPDVAIINVRTEQAVRTNTKGFFQIEIMEGDSLITNHIAFKKRVITEANNARTLFLEPEIRELQPIDVTTDNSQEEQQMKEMAQSINQIARQKKLDGFDRKSRQTYFYDQHGSYNRGFSPHFGPTVGIPLGKITRLFKRKSRKSP